MDQMRKTTSKEEYKLTKTKKTWENENKIRKQRCKINLDLKDFF